MQTLIVQDHHFQRNSIQACHALEMHATDTGFRLVWSPRKAWQSLALRVLCVALLSLGVDSFTRWCGAPLWFVIVSDIFVLGTLLVALVYPAVQSLRNAIKKGVVVQAELVQDGSIRVSTSHGIKMCPPARIRCTYFSRSASHRFYKTRWAVVHESVEYIFFQTALTIDPIDQELRDACKKLGIHFEYQERLGEGDLGCMPQR